MIQFVGYNFLSDGNALDPVPTNVDNITQVTVQSAEFDNFYVTKDVTSAYSTEVPTDWDFYTIMLANFDGTISAGSIDAMLDQVDTIRIKRRKSGDFDWDTIFEQPINSVEDFSFSGVDYFAINEEEYEYAWVPVLAGIEGNYITNSIESQFQGVYICDADTIYKFMVGIEYGASSQKQLVGIYNPIGQKYPVYVSNAATNYQTGSFTGKLIGNYETTGVFNRKEMVQQKNQFLAWLTNKKAKIIKDWNGSSWCVYVTGEPQITYDNQWGMGMMDVSFEYGEIGDVDNLQDLQNVGLRPTYSS